MADAELYASASGGQRRLTARVLDEVWARLDWSREGPALDVGCGAGDCTLLELLPRLPATTSLVAADSSPDMLRKAITRFNEPRVVFQLLDIASPYVWESAVSEWGPYSKVFSFFCLHWVQNQRRALYNMAQLLVPGGDAVLVLVGRCPLFDLYRDFSRRPQWAPYMQDYREFVSPYHLEEDPEQRLRTLLAECGFTVMSCRVEEDFAFSSTNHQEILDSLEAVVPFAARIPAEERQSFLVDLVAACYTNGTLSVERGAEADLLRWNFSILVAHAVRGAAAGEHSAGMSSLSLA